MDKTQHTDQTEGISHVTDPIVTDPIVTDELCDDLIELIGNNNPQVKHGALSAILQYTANQESKQIFLKKDILGCLLKCLPLPALRRLTLSALIHFSDCDQYIISYISLLEPLLSTTYNLQEEQIFLLLLLNLTRNESIITDLFEKNLLHRIVDRVLSLSNNNVVNVNRMAWILYGIMVNVTAVERGRKYVGQEGIHLKCMLSLQCPEQRVRLSILQILRNCAFEWEDPSIITLTLAPEHNYLDNLARFIVLTIKANQLTAHSDSLALKYCGGDEQLMESRCKAIKGSTGVKQIETTIDIVLILSNCDFKEKATGIMREEFKDMLSLVKFTPVSEETKDKLEALEIFGV